MKDSKLNSSKYQPGDRVEYYPHPLDEAAGLDFRSEGVIKKIKEDEVIVELKSGEIRTFCEWEIEPYVDYASLNEREKLKYRYRRWVIDYTGLFEKSHVTMEEVQSKYSELAINFAINELEKIAEISADGKTRDGINKRVSYLNSLVG